jgi:hypothetical protein
MANDLETRTQQEEKSNPISERLSYVYQTTNRTGKYLLELARVEVEYTLLSMKIATLSLIKRGNK